MLILFWIIQIFGVLILVLFSEQLRQFNSQVEDSTMEDFFHPLASAEVWSRPSLTAHDRELVSIL